MELKKIKEIFSFEKGSLQSSKCTAGEYNFITASSKWKTHNSFDYECEALVVAVAASGSLGRVHYINDKFISSDLCFVLKPKDSSKFPVNLEFYYSIFKSLKEDLVKSTATGTAKKSINKTNFGNYVIPYYNIEEQNRLKPVFEKVADNSEKINQELSNQKQLVSKLKQSILQEAIQGKLTADWRVQNPDTEPASELLNRIKSEKNQLIKDKKIKKEKALPPITVEEIPFELPSGWVWCRLIDISLFVNGDRSEKYPSGTDIVEQGVPFFNSKSVYDDKVNLDNKDLQYITQAKFDSLGGGKLEYNDLLMVLRGSGRGKSGLYSDKIPGFINAQLIIIRGLGEFLHSFFITFFKCSLFFQQADKAASGSAQPHISGKDLKEVIIPIPPLAEQKAIVKKVESLMQKCMALEKEIKTSEANAQILMQAVLKEAFVDKKEEVVI